jgi:uncharacterized protein YaeQ
LEWSRDTPRWTSGQAGHEIAARLAAKYTFQFVSDDRRRPLPHKLLLALQPNESNRHIALKLLGWLLFWRERMQVETEVPDDSIPFVPDVCVLGYDLRPQLWLECGDCGTAKLHKVSVKCQEAEIWCLKRSPAEAEGLLQQMAKDELRRGRFGVIAFDPPFFDEVAGLLRERNTLHWFRGGLGGEPGIDEPTLQFELNGLWFDTTFRVWRY